MLHQNIHSYINIVILICFLLEKLFESITTKPKEDNKHKTKYNKSPAPNGTKQPVPHTTRTNTLANMVLNYIHTYSKKVMCEKK